MTTQHRSVLMSKIRSKDTTPERKFRMELVRHGISGWKTHEGTGKADFLFPKEKVTVFIDSCFWHGCPTHFKPPKTNKRYWRKHISDNIERGEKVNRILKKEGWKVVRIWGHDLKGGKEVREEVGKIVETLKDDERPNNFINCSDGE